jgi:hypothetical protein
MKTKTRKTTRILCASTIAAMTILGSVAPALTTVMADDSAKVYMSGSENTISFTKKLNLDEGENTPNVTIKYTLATRTATPTEKTAFSNENYTNVENGPTDHETVPTVSDSVFSASNDTKKEGSVVKPSEINAQKLVAATKVPTVYTYNITETAYIGNTDNLATFITPKTSETKKLNVYVGYKSDTDKTLQVLYATFANEDNSKATGFENEYKTSSDGKDTQYKFRVKKTVTGNQGDKTKFFNFTIKLHNQYSKVTATVDNGGKDLVASNEPDEKGDLTLKVKLKDGASVNIDGLTKGATYETSDVVETEAGQDNYTTNLEQKLNHDEGINEIVVTNNKEGTIPTGIYLNHKLPFNILGVALAGGAVALIAKKRHEDVLEDEDDE